MTEAAMVRTEQGAVSGQAQDGFTVFRGIPYAAPPTGALRWAPPQPAAPWSGVRDATAEPPIAPQNPSRLAAVMGDFAGEQSEDCLSLTVWRPEPAGAKRPVLVWIHGGGFTQDGARNYDGTKLAAVSYTHLTLPTILRV